MSLGLRRTRRYSKDDDQTADHERRSNKCSQGYTAAAGRELPSDHPVLTLKIAVEADEEDEDGYPDKGGA